MSMFDDGDFGDEEVETPVEELRVVQTDLDDGAGSEVHSEPTSPDDLREEPQAGGGGGGFAALLGGMDEEELEELTQRVASGQIRIESDDDRPDPVEQTINDGDPPAETPSDEEEAEAQPQAVEEAQPDPDGDGSPKRARIRVTSEEDAAVVADIRENPGTSIAEALERVRARVETVADEFDADAPAKPSEPSTAQLYATVAEAEDALLEMESARDKAMFEDYDDAEAKRISEEMRELRRSMPRIREAEAQAREQASASAQADYDAKFAASKALAEDLFPDVTDPQSALYKEVVRLDREAKESDPDLWNDPDKFFQLTRRAVVALRSSSSPSVSATPSAHARVPAARGVAAPSSSRATTTPATANAVPGLGKRVDELDVDDLAELDALMSLR